MSLKFDEAKMTNCRKSECLVSTYYSSIGKVLQTLLNIEDTMDPEKLGQDFVRYYGDIAQGISNRQIAKMLLTDLGYSKAVAVGYVQQSVWLKDLFFVSKPLTVSNPLAECTIQYFQNVESDLLKNREFFIQDFVNECKTFVVLDKLISLGNQGGKTLVREIQKLVNCPIILQAGFLLYGDYEHFSETRDLSVVNDLVKYYEELGFVNVNDRIGQYKESVVMLYTPTKEKDRSVYPSIENEEVDIESFMNKKKKN